MQMTFDQLMTALFEAQNNLNFQEFIKIFGKALSDHLWIRYIQSNSLPSFYKTLDTANRAKLEAYIVNKDCASKD